ncbi:tetratricopeptide repeat protein [Streptomyces sp. Amel2xC10]|uniref:tetratricopeptide repeat protein n=1 Tax=Streptomyces sp. Amel2xC10 TaxID=1305826 RepID=UPI000A08741E|nr:tetratricopeptide repeat protein [Streptomyces sp. Amel2xC10]SMF86318.1 Tetratricopeptide repeat-containing protein [Streptomyces sp. Amel2xC10]
MVDPSAGDISIRDRARWNSAARDQYIVEIGHQYVAHHTAMPGPAVSERSGPDSVRVPLAARSPSPIRDRHDVRRDVLHAISHPGASPQAFVFHGMAGSGKTALAGALFDEAVTRGVVGLWVNAATEVAFRAGMLAIALDRGADPDQVEAARSGSRPAADLVWHYLDRSPDPWLLVLDNADDPRVLRDGVWLRRSARGTVIVTTRHGNAPLWQDCDRRRLDALHLDDAVHVLRDLNITETEYDQAALEKLAKGLGCHPLALTLAGSYLDQRVLDRVTVDEFLRRLRDDPSGTLDEAADPDERDLRRLISTTWQISLDALAERGVPQATPLMWLLSCYAPDPLPIGLLHPRRLELTALDTAEPPLLARTADAALRGLISQSMVSDLTVPGDVGQPTVPSIQAHALLLDTVAARIPLDQREGILTAAVHLLDHLLHDGESESEGTFLDAQTLRLFTPHALSLLERATAAHSVSAPKALGIVRYLRDQSREHGDYASAHLLADAAVRVPPSVSAATEAALLNDRYELACSLADLGRYAESVELHREVLRERETRLGPDDVQTLASAHALGIALYGLGEWAQDEHHLRRAVDGRSRILGPEHPDTIMSTACLAEAIGEQHRWDEAESLARANLATSEAAHGPASPYTLAARHTLAWALYQLGRLDEAEALATATLSEREASLGSAHPRTLVVRDLLAGILRGLQRWAEAEIAARTVLNAREEVLGPEHPHTLAMRTELIRILTGAGESAAAQSLAERNLEACIRILGDEHPDTRACREAHRDAFGPHTRADESRVTGHDKDVQR